MAEGLTYKRLSVVPENDSGFINLSHMTWSRQHFAMMLQFLHLPKEYVLYISTEFSRFAYFAPTDVEACHGKSAKFRT